MIISLAYIAFALLLLFGRAEGVLLLSGIVAYNWMSVVFWRREGADKHSDVPAPTISRHWGIDVVFVAASVGVLVLGSRLLVDHSVVLAKTLGVSEAVIGLTIVAAGTSMPELATSVVAAARKQPDIAIGNIVGSNIFNILAILGLASVISSLHAPGISQLDYAVMVVFAVLLIPLLYTGRLLHRLEGATLLALYGGYLYILWP